MSEDRKKEFTRSGNFDDRRTSEPSSKVKRRAEEIAKWEVGDANEWDQFVEQAQGEINWAGYEAWLKRRGWKFVQAYQYRTPEGHLLYEALRYTFHLLPSKKTYVLRHREAGAWVRGAGPVRVPFNLPEILARPGDAIVLVEGEKGADIIKAKGLLASCVQGQNWTDDVAQYFTGRTVNVAMDNDDGGRDNTATACHWLHKVSAKVRVLDLPDLPPRGGLDDWLEQHSLEDYQALATNTKPEPSVADLRLVNPADWADKPVPARMFLVPPLIPDRNVALLYGDGGLGKSLLALQLAVSRASRHDWLGLQTAPGSTLILSAEDDLDELHRRLAAICLHYKVSLGDLSAIRLIDLVGQDAVIGELNRSGRIVATALHHFMMREIAKFSPGLVIVDALADSFAGDENNRTQARQFISMLRRPALNYDCAFLAVAHPSLSGISSGRGTSGSTGWSNSVRARMYFETVEINGNEPDPNLKKLRQPKANYAGPGFEVALRYENGVFVPVSNGVPLGRMEKMAQAEGVFMVILKRLFEQERFVGNSSGINYAPAVFAGEREATELMISKEQLKAAMVRLFENKRIRLEPHGKPSRHKTRIAEAPL